MLPWQVTKPRGGLVHLRGVSTMLSGLPFMDSMVGGQRVAPAIVAIVVFRCGHDALPRWVMAHAVSESESLSL
jgi:hypothetical protein